MRGRVAARKVLVVLDVAERAGLSREELLVRLGLPRDLDPDAWLPQTAWRSVWQIVVAETGDEDIGLQAAQEIDAGYFGVIEYAVRACATVGEAIGVASRYFRLANTWGHIEVEQDAEAVRISRRIAGDEAMWLPRQAAEFALVTMVRLFREGAARPLPLARVCFRHPAPRDDRAHRAFFACPLAHGQPEDAIELPLAALSIPMRSPDARLRSLVESYGATLLAQAEDEASVATLVRGVVAPRLSQGAPDVAWVARRLGMGQRTLQRRLTEEGTSFREVIDALREALARASLQQGRSPGEVAFLLGFSEVAAFHRAFCRWTGQTPGAWRAGASGRENGTPGR